MSGSGLSAAVLRFWSGTLGGILLGYAAFRGRIFDAGDPAFQCLTIGALLAVILSAVRGGRIGESLAMVTGFGLLQLGLNWHAGLGRAIAATVSGLFLGGGIFLVAVVFDRMAERGVRFLKFLIAGPLLGGVYFAVSPLAGGERLTATGGFETLFMNLYLGVIIGDGVGLGVELIELVPGLGGRRRPVTVSPPAVGREGP